MGCIACQPILNTKKNIFGYELLSRSSPTSKNFDGNDGDKATRELLSTAFGDVGIKKITGGKRSFVNFPESLLRDDLPLLFSKDILVIEILESVEPNPENVEVCRKLRKQGYMLALDDFVYSREEDEMLKIANIVKIDFLQYPDRTGLSEVIDNVRRVNPNIVLLAEKVETEDNFNMARELGFTLFQGYFFARPKLHAGRHLRPVELSRLQLLRCLHGEEIDFAKISQITKRDLALSHKLLRIVNSSRYGLNFYVSSILHAFTILGTEETKKWLSFVVMENMAGDSEKELSRMALMRGLFMEKLTVPLRRKSEKETFFMFGLFSMADAMMRAPMEDVLSQTNLSQKITEPLLTGEGELADLLQMLIAYERAKWDKVTELAEQFGLNEDQVSKFYLDALQEAYELL